MDLLGGNSFCGYSDNVMLNLTTIFLIIASGLGFPVYWEIARLARPNRRKTSEPYTRKMNLQTKLVLWSTLSLILAGTILTLLFESDNPATLGAMSLPGKLMAALFQSVTLRTAGFVTIPQEYFRPASALVYLVLMFIGGSPAGTAGGVKTVTVVLLFASMFANIRGKKDVNVMHRKIADETIRRCVAIIAFSFSVLFVLTTVLLAVQQSDFLDTVYEMTSAIATVGLSRGLTGTLGSAGKIIDKTYDEVQGKILTKVGADKIVYPEKEMGVHLANDLAFNHLFDAIELTSEYSITDIPVLNDWVDKDLKELNLRKKYDVNVIAVKRGGALIINPPADQPTKKSDIFVLLGTNSTLKKIASLTNATKEK